MIQRSQHLRFALKASQPLGIVRKRFGENLDRYITPEFCVVGLADFAHAAGANLREEFVRAETCAGADGHYFFPVGTFCFNSSNQFSTTLICVSDCACSAGLSIRNRWPSGE